MLILEIKMKLFSLSMSDQMEFSVKVSIIRILFPVHHRIHRIVLQIITTRIVIHLITLIANEVVILKKTFIVFMASPRDIVSIKHKLLTVRSMLHLLIMGEIKCRDLIQLLLITIVML